MKSNEFRVRIDHGTAAERLAMLRKALSITGHVELAAETAGTFTGEAFGRLYGELMVHEVRADPFLMSRDRPWVRSVTRDMIFANVVLDGEMSGRYRGRSYHVGTGCLTLSRLSSEMSVMMPPRRVALAIPKALLDTRMAWKEPLDGRVFPATSAVTILLTRYINGLLALGALTLVEQKAVLNATLDLMAALLGTKAVRPTLPARARDSLLSDIRRFILTHLNDSSLDALMICGEFQLSHSQLSRLLGKGFNLAESIRRMRLHKAYYELLEGREVQKTVKAVAAKWGIADERTFRRTFRAEFGRSPSEVMKLGAPGAQARMQIAQSMAELESWFKET